MESKNILILGSKESFSIERMYERAFKSLGYRTKLLHVYEIRKGFIHRLIWKYFRFFYFFFIRIKIINYLKKNNKYDLIILYKGL